MTSSFYYANDDDYFMRTKKFIKNYENGKYGNKFVSNGTNRNDAVMRISFSRSLKTKKNSISFWQVRMCRLMNFEWPKTRKSIKKLNKLVCMFDNFISICFYGAQVTMLDEFFRILFLLFLLGWRSEWEMKRNNFII